MISYYFHHRLFCSGFVGSGSELSEFFDTNLNLTVGDLLNHRGKLFDYLELDQNTINTFDLDKVCEEILARSSCQQSSNAYEYSNSSYVLLSKIIEVVTGRSYQEEVQAFYLDRGVDFSFSDEFSNYIAGWGDGAIVSDVRNYLNFMSLEDVHQSFDLLVPKHNCRYFCGAVPGWYSLAVLTENLKFVLFTTRSDGEVVTDKILNEFEAYFK